jgi:hypothetical protein
MRRFRLLDTTGAVRGEGVYWNPDVITVLHDDISQPMNHEFIGREVGMPPDEWFSGRRVEWLDPESGCSVTIGLNGEFWRGAAAYSHDGVLQVNGAGRIGGYGSARFAVLTREQAERLPVAGGNGGTGKMRLDGDPPDPAAFQLHDGDPAILEGVEGHVENTERGLRFVPKGSR